MTSHLVAPLLALSLVSSSHHAHAYAGPPALVPATPVAGQIVTVSIPYGVCDAVSSDGDVLGYPQVTIAGNFIHVVAASLHAFDNEECIYPMGVATETIGPLAAGKYTVRVDREYNNGSITVETIGVLSLSVQSASVSNAVSALGPLNRMITILLLAMLGCLAVRCRSRSILTLVLSALVGSSLVPVRAQVFNAPQPATMGLGLTLIRGRFSSTHTTA